MNETAIKQKDSTTSGDEEKSGITFGDIWHIIVKHWRALIVWVIASLACGSVYALAFKKPVYQSTGSVIVLADNTSSTAVDTSGINTTNLSLSLNLVPSIVSFMNDTPVLQMVTNDIVSSGKFSTSYLVSDIKKLVSTSARDYTSTEKSLYIDVTSDTSDKDLSVALVASVLKNAVTLANDTTQDYSRVFKDTMIVSSSASEPIDTSMSTAKVLLISGAVGVVVGVIYDFIFELANTHVGSSKEIESLTGLKVIGYVPDVSMDEKATRARKKAEDGEEKEGND